MACHEHEGVLIQTWEHMLRAQVCCGPTFRLLYVFVELVTADLQKSDPTAVEEQSEAKVEIIVCCVSACAASTLFFPGEEPVGLPFGAIKKNRGDVVPKVT